MPKLAHALSFLTFPQVSFLPVHHLQRGVCLFHCDNQLVDKAVLDLKASLWVEANLHP